MQTVKAIKALPGYREGEVFSVDEDSAKVLKDRGDVELVDETDTADGTFAPTGRGNMSVVQVVGADYPEQSTGTGAAPAAEADGDDDADSDDTAPTAADADEVPVTKSSNKSDLVAYAVGRVTHDDGTALTEAELESLTKPELVDKLGL